LLQIIRTIAQKLLEIYIEMNKTEIKIYLIGNIYPYFIMQE